METIHIVQPFERNKRGMLPRQAMQFTSAAGAAARAEEMAGNWTGVVAYSMDIDEAGGDYSVPLILYQSGEVPELG